MKKALLIGSFSVALNHVTEYLSSEYSVQLSTMQIDSVSEMVSVVRPNLIAICSMEVNKLDQELIDWIRNNCIETPILMVTSVDNWNLIQASCEGLFMRTVLEPFSGADVMDACHAMIPMGNKRILIVDDSAIVLRSIKAMLEGKYNVELATSGAMAVDKVKKQDFDLVLMDYEMPIMNGNATFKALKNMDEGKDLPVVFLTSVTDQTRIVEVLKNHPAGYVLKPPDREKLLVTIRGIIGV